MVKCVSLPLPQYSHCLGHCSPSPLVSQTRPICCLSVWADRKLLEVRVSSSYICVVGSRSLLNACCSTGSNKWLTEELMGERLRHRNKHTGHSTQCLRVFPSSRQSAPWVRKQTWPASCQVPSPCQPCHAEQLMTSIMSFETHNDPMKERQQVPYLCFIIRQWTPAGIEVYISESWSADQGYKFEEQGSSHSMSTIRSLLGISTMWNLSVNMQILAQ